MNKSIPYDAIGRLLDQAMDQAVANGANAISMPDDYVEIAHWLAFPDDYTPGSEVDVRRILLDIVPGDGSGLEVYARNIKDVEDKLTELSQELEDALIKLESYK
jgi:hypothetical protein